MTSNDGVKRRSLLTLAGTAAAASAAGCLGGGGGGGTTTKGKKVDVSVKPMENPKTRSEHIQKANAILHNQAPWIFLNRQYSVYGKSTKINWKARRDERIDAYAISPKGDKTSVTITQGQMDSGLDPHDHRETPTDNIVLQAYEGLLTRDREGAVQNELATGYERVKDGLVRFTLRDGVSFHNGDPFTAEDAAFSINRIVKKEVGPDKQASQLAGVTGAEATGDMTVDVMSDGLNPTVFSSFATYCDIVQKSWIQNNSKAYINSHVNGTGPFKLKNYEQDVRVVYERNGDYWKDPADVKELTMNAAKESSTRVNQLVAGETDIIVNVPPQEVSRVKNSSAAEISAVPSTRIIFNAMRYDVEPFSSPKFRQAMNYAIDLNSIVKNVLQTFGAATAQPTLEGFTGHRPNTPVYPQAKSKAESLVEESGHAGVSITLHTPVGRYLKDLAIAQAVAGQINQLSNVNCSVKQREFGKLASELTTGKIEDKPHFYLIGWGEATFDGALVILPLLTSDGALSTYGNDQVDSLVQEAQNLPGQG